MSALSFKGAGNRLFNASDFAGAIDQYSQAIEAARAAPGGADSADSNYDPAFQFQQQTGNPLDNGGGAAPPGAVVFVVGLPARTPRRPTSA